MKLNLQLFVLCCCVYLSLTVPTLDEDIGQTIFHESTFAINADKTYTLYIYENQNQKVLNIFNQFCEGKLCALIGPQVDQYEDFRSFTGVTEEDFFIILDASTQSKYILTITEKFKLEDLVEFRNGFESGNLSPYYASEKQPEKNNQKCLKIVGNTMDSFLSTPIGVKVLFLYTENQACSLCPDMLKLFKKMAVNLYDEKVVSFGYLDLFANDHRLLKEYSIPHFLLFKEGYEEPFELVGEKMDKLYDFIISVVVKDTDIDPKEFDDMMEERMRKMKDVNYEELKEFQQDLQKEEQVSQQEQTQEVEQGELDLEIEEEDEESEMSEKDKFIKDKVKMLEEMGKQFEQYSQQFTEEQGRKIMEEMGGLLGENEISKNPSPQTVEMMEQMEKMFGQFNMAQMMAENPEAMQEVLKQFTAKNKLEDAYNQAMQQINEETMEGEPTMGEEEIADILEGGTDL